MKLETINLQLVKNIGNYETIRLGGEWSVDKSETLNEALQSARVALEDSFKDMQQAAGKAQAYEDEQATETAPNGQPKERLIFGTAKFQAVLNKIKAGVSVDEVRKWYIVSEADMEVLTLQSNI